MHDMSNTRKEIAARLGFAAGNSAKEAKAALDAWRLASQKEETYLGSVFVNPMKQREMEARTQAAYELAKRLNPDYQGFSRPGAKAKFGRAEDVYRLLETTPSSYNNAKKLDALATEAMRLADITPAGKNVSLHELAEMVGQDLEGDRSRASRPGAKAEMARWEEHTSEGWGDLSKSLTATINGTKFEIVVDASTGKGMLMRGTQVVKEGAVEQLKKYAETMKASRPGTKTTMTREQTEEQKAGLKIMSAADPAVGAKIAKLIKEGKPQDQAVAIALDMKRRGEL
jgi:hypothetical protein